MATITVTPPIIHTITAMTDPVTPQALTKVMAWFSPAFPTGGFSYSHGLEAAQEAGLLPHADALIDHLRADLHQGAGRDDAILIAATFRALGNEEALLEVARLAAAYRVTAELSAETEVQGRSFLSVAAQAFPAPGLEEAIALLKGEGVTITLPIAAGIVGAAHDIPLPLLLTAYLQGMVENLVHAGIRLIPLGHTEGQRVTAALADDVVAVASSAETLGLDDLGSAALTIDMLSMIHERQYSRMFRS